ncbi:MAG TPA: 50S ribosomal protein L35 [bacterium]|jgi:large subunit ribosomal protein L35|nr:50S ribosomal protein L35 [bacterium]HOG37950.1 50S ribosomal protein L35 [bacterium]HQI03008.1 50S ribosomal protein L35 [bacterium]
MPKLKTYKTLSKRIRITKNGKVIRRSKSQDHFNTRETGKTKRNKRKDVKVSDVYSKNISKL